jgi:tetratricopeptide (TPR) repeat protein
MLPTYSPGSPDKNPMFLERRVYQGSSGRVYPLPFIGRMATEAADHSWQALHIENDFIRVMILPEIGGRIHVGLDKTNGYDFFYRQNVIKPALVGLAGPWISGGVEFNWPQHHRPATFMPVDWKIEHHSKGSCTIWCSDHDPFHRLKGMHGVCLHPDRSYIELKVRLCNRTQLVQTFLWWANVATHVDEYYQSFFPPDVHWVADHANRAMSKFPLCDGRYYGVDYASRAQHGVPENERPRIFVPPGTYPPNDLTWYANIPVPTSYMAVGSRGDFSGGYDHQRQAGLVHVANHHISPGKKQWTWGNHEFGYTWDRNLTDRDGPYVELMAGVYTDNQPDFSFLCPGETKEFSQFWYPIQKIGPVQAANTDAALSLHVQSGVARVGICTTKVIQNARIELRHEYESTKTWGASIAPDRPFQAETSVGAGPVTVTVLDAESNILISYCHAEQSSDFVPRPATEPPVPANLPGNDELYLTGVHLEQYRHATRSPEPYWREAIHRDPGDWRSNHALGLFCLRRGEFQKAESFLRTTIDRITGRNANPRNCEPFYSLGLTLRYLGRTEEAYDAFYKATWDYAWRSPAYLAIAEIDATGKDLAKSLEHVRLCLRTNVDHTIARNLGVMLLRQLGRAEEAQTCLRETLELDPLDHWALYLNGQFTGNNQVRLDLAFDLIRSGFLADAKDVLEHADRKAQDGSVPMVLYTLAYIARQSGHITACRLQTDAKAASPDYCFPNRLEEFIVLRDSLAGDPADYRALYYLGNWLYDRGRQEEAIEHWRHSAELDPEYSVVWRNFGIALFNVRGDAEGARTAFDKALASNPKDARILYERDQLWKRIGVDAKTRLAELEGRPELVQTRDDLTVEMAALYNQTAQPQRAAVLMTQRRFQPWEGGEGAVLGQYVRTKLALGREALASCNAARAKSLFQEALEPPENLGEAWHLLANKSNIYYFLGEACYAAGEHSAAEEWWRKAAEASGDFQDMSVRPYSEMTYYSALALMRLNRNDEARHLLRSVMAYARALRNTLAKIDYFATSLPAMLLFNDDLQRRNQITSLFLEAQASAALRLQRRRARVLKRVLEMDPNHAAAADFESELLLGSTAVQTA